MKHVNLTISEIVACLGNQYQKTIGDSDKVIDNITDASSVNENSLDWINPSKKNKQSIAESTKAKVILVDENVVFSDSLIEQGKTLIVVKDPKKALAIVGNAFFVEKPKPGIHPTAIIDNDAKIGKDVCMGPYCVIGKCEIGDGTTLAAYVRIYDNVVIGNNCKVRDGAILGGEGFGFEKDENDNWMKFPQIGSVKIGNFVEVGPHACIDRGALSQTVVGDYCKLEANVHIAHNCKVGNNCVFTGGCGIAGSCVIGDNVWFGPSAKVNNWLTVGNNAKICMGSMVLTNVKEGQTVFGYPAKKFEL